MNVIESQQTIFQLQIEAVSGALVEAVKTTLIVILVVGKIFKIVGC